MTNQDSPKPLKPKQRRSYQRHLLLKEKLKEQKISEAELARCLGVKQSTVFSWKQGKFQPRVQYIRTMCKILDCSADELLGVEHIPFKRVNRALYQGLYKAITKNREYDAGTIHQMATVIGRVTGGRLSGFEIWLRSLAEAVYNVEIGLKPKKNTPEEKCKQLKLFK